MPNLQLIHVRRRLGSFSDTLQTLQQKKLNEPLEEIDTLTVEELRHPLNAPNKRKFSEFRDYVLMNVLLDAMLRIGEAKTLIIYEDLEKSIIHVRDKNAKNRKYRIIPIQKQTKKLIAELIAENKVDFDSEYIFLANYGEPIDRIVSIRSSKFMLNRCV
ncbi:tyrosine-type recombinase/integrase [Bacillus paramycoides]|uniref:tyrosine-type recombinase/integrase n=1 Tax=Bacillus paramycoides TaxID=2026194 RepID=UPI0022439D9B|nr:tyrosine-type recombinase/integrase [Bacillus paramycoides]MCW9133896.1 tyrosine-type recombinase/integrase [Bacillus paramycoides]